MEHLVGACWSVTSECNMNCPICCKIDDKEILSISDKLKIIDNISNSGLIKLNFTGGEPLLDPDIFKLLSYSKSKGLKTALSTNGLLLDTNYLDKLNDIIDEMQLPLDGHTEDIHYGIRNSRNHFRKIKELIPKIKRYNFQLDISTVVTAKNIDYLVELGKMIESLGADKWKLFQFNPISYGYINRKDYYLLEEEFLIGVEKVKSLNLSIDFDYGIANEKRLKSYFNISPSGYFFLPNKHKYNNYGSVLTHKNLSELASHTDFEFRFHTNRFWRDIG